MEACGNGAIQTEVLVGIDLGTVSANTTFCAELSAALTVALRAIGAVHIIVDCTFDADYRTCLLTAVQTGLRAICALAAFLAPAANVKITLPAAGTVILVIGGTFPANNRTYGL